MRCGHRPAIEPGGEAEPGRRHADAEAPAHWRHHLAKQWRPNDLDEVIERVEQHKSRPARQGFGRPEYRGQEKYDLDHVGYHLWDIAIAGGEHPDRQRYPRGVDQEQDEAGDEQQGVPSGRQLEPDHHEEIDRHVEAPDHDIARHHPVKMDAERHGQVADIGFRRDEYRGAFVDAAREQAPEDDAGRNIGHRLGSILVKQGGEYEAQRRDQNTHRKRQPERAEHRAPKPLPDIVDGEAAPQLVEPGAVEEIGEGLRRHRFRGYAGDGRFLLGKGGRGHAGGQLGDFVAPCYGQRAFSTGSWRASPDH
jgi:hypothetical protein